MIVADLDKPLPQLNGQFDVIIYGDILEHLRNPMEVFTGFNRSLATGRPGDCFRAQCRSFVGAAEPVAGPIPVMPNRGILDRTHLRFFTLSLFKRFLADAGLECDEIVATPVPLLLVVPKHAQGIWLRAVHALNAGLARRWKRMFGYQFVAVAHSRKTS
jgi:hypothetical protein